MMQIADLNDLIRRRRAVYPKNYVVGKPISKEILEQILENANWAPTHKLSEPWRFRVFHSEESRRQLGEYLAETNERNSTSGPLAPEKKQRILENPQRSGCVIALVMRPDPTLPEWEEVAAVACAVQNMWLTCAALGLGAYWSSMKAALEARDFLQLEAEEKCVGLFYIGWSDLPEIAGKRRPVAEKTTWL